MSSKWDKLTSTEYKYRKHQNHKHQRKRIEQQQCLRICHLCQRTEIEFAKYKYSYTLKMYICDDCYHRRS